jgi:hypothetical protein
VLGQVIAEAVHQLTAPAETMHDNDDFLGKRRQFLVDFEAIQFSKAVFKGTPSAAAILGIDEPIVTERGA